MSDESNEVNYSSFNARVIATMIDALILLLIIRLFSFAIVPATEFIHSLLNIQVNMGYYRHNLASVITLSDLYILISESGLLKKMIIDFIISFLIYSAFILPFWLKFASSPGKFLVGARIVDSKTMQKPSNTKLILRMLSYIISLLPIMIGFICIGFDKKKRGLHDHILGTYVISKFGIKVNQEPLYKKVYSKYKELLKK